MPCACTCEVNVFCKTQQSQNLHYKYSFPNFFPYGVQILMPWYFMSFRDLIWPMKLQRNFRLWNTLMYLHKKLSFVFLTEISAWQNWFFAMAQQYSIALPAISGWYLGEQSICTPSCFARCWRRVSSFRKSAKLLIIAFSDVPSIASFVCLSFLTSTL